MDDRCGVVVYVEVTTGQPINTVSADTGYAYGKKFTHLEERHIDAIIPPQNEHNSPRVCQPDDLGIMQKTRRSPARLVNDCSGPFLA